MGPQRSPRAAVLGHFDSHLPELFDDSRGESSTCGSELLKGFGKREGAPIWLVPDCPICFDKASKPCRIGLGTGHVEVAANRFGCDLALPREEVSEKL